MRVYNDGHAEADADTRPPEVCDRCGRPKKIIKFIVVYAPEEAGRREV